jgi:glycosyltransferase involved in cell wall biosynthesis
MITVLHPRNYEDIDGGVKVSSRQQRKALEQVDGIELVDTRDEDYDLLHLNYLGPRAPLYVRSAKQDGKPIVMHAHSVGENIAGTFLLSSVLGPVIRRYYTALYNRADTVIAVSQCARDRLRENNITSPIEVISNGVDGQALDGFEETESLADQYGSNDLKVVNIAQVYEIKGIDTFIRSGRANNDMDFIWFGPRHRLLAPLSTRWKLRQTPENVFFPGFIDDKRQAFRTGDIFLFPSHRETQGISVLEAAYCGMPIIVRDIPAFRGWLEHGENCLKASTDHEFQDHLTRLRDDPGLREQLGSNARELASRHTLDRIGERLHETYRSLLD